MNKHKIIKEAMSFKQRILELKRDSSYYPSILIREYPNDHSKYKKVIFASTLVRIKRNGKYYIVHSVESIINTPNITKTELLLKLIDSVHKITHLYNLTCKYDNIDILQEDEEIRLIKTLADER